MRRQQVFGYTHEELKLLVAPMASDGGEAIGSMGTDTPIAVLSDRPRLLFDYFQQLFAQVTNPPLDAIREELVTSLSCDHRPRGQPARRRARTSCRQVELPFPIIDNDELAKLIHIDDDGDRPDFAAQVISGPVPRRRRRRRRCARRSTSVPREASAAIAAGKRILVLSDRDSNAECAPIPSLLLTSAVHHHLIREKTRTQVGPGRRDRRRARSAPHGAARRATAPARSTRTWRSSRSRTSSPQGLYGLGGADPHAAIKNYIKAAGKGVLKVMSKMGISTVASYTRRAGVRGDRPRPGARRRVLHRHRARASAASASTRSPRRSPAATAIAYSDRPDERAHRDLELGGEYQWRREGEYHLFNPETVFKLQHATRAKRYDVYKEYTRLVDDQSTRLATLRGLFTLPRRACGRRCRSTRSSRSARSSSASPPARCRTARSPRKRTRPWPSR